jgi:putative flippase GtrA
VTETDLSGAGSGVGTAAPGRLHRIWQSQPVRRVMHLPGLRIIDGKLESEQYRKMVRYAGVSVVFVPVGQILIQILGYLIGKGGGDDTRSYTIASVLSAAILTLPNFFANKRYVWRDNSEDNLRTQVAVFWVAAMLGVAIATTFTYIVESAVDHRSGLVKAAAVFFAQLAGFGVVWVGRFLVLDRWIFKVTHGGEEPTPEEVEELHADLPI